MNTRRNFNASVLTALAPSSTAPGAGIAMPRLRGRSGESAYSDFPDRRGDELASARVGKASWAKEHGYPHELELQDGPCILVAHSCGGTIITEAGVDPHVTALV